MIALLLVAAMQAPPAPVTPAIANPASVYCIEQGGRLEIVRGPAGDVGWCILPDGRRIEEWEFFRQRSPR